MRLRFTGPNGESINNAVSNLFNNMLNLLREKSGKMIQWALLFTTKNHIKERYPNSQHWNPDKVTEDSVDTLSGSINIDIPGVTRNYHDLDIYPRQRRALTIPIHPMAKRHKAADFNNLFKPRGKDYLALLLNGVLTPLFLLRKHVHQRQDNTLLPSDKTYYTNIWARINNYLDLKSNTITN